MRRGRDVHQLLHRDRKATGSFSVTKSVRRCRETPHQRLHHALAFSKAEQNDSDQRIGFRCLLKVPLAHQCHTPWFAPARVGVPVTEISFKRLFSCLLNAPLARAYSNRSPLSDAWRPHRQPYDPSPRDEIRRAVGPRDLQGLRA